MNPRERVRATLDHCRPDRVPMVVAGRNEVDEALMQHYGVSTLQEVLEILDADLWRSVGVKIRRPGFEARANGELTGDFGSSGRAIVHDARTFEDLFGVVFRVGRDGKYLEWVDGPFTQTDDLDSFEWPGPADVVPAPDLKQRVAALKAAGYWVSGSGGRHPFKQSWHMRGFENFLCDYVADPGFVERMYERFLALDLAACRASAEAGCDMIEYYGDVAMQDRMLVPPEAWRRLDKPFWAELIRRTRQVKPDMVFFFHCDGDLTPIMDDLVEVGFDIIDPIQPECMDPARVKERWGRHVTLQGGGSVQRTLPFGTPADVRREVEYLLETCAYDGGFILRASNAIGFDCPVENVVAFFETARDYDLSQLTGPPARIPDRPPCLSVPIRV